MNYTTVPRSLIYRNRRSMEEFGAYDSDSITRPLAEAIIRLDFIQYADSENRALWCMNTAFYICTMILLETDPRWRLSDYKRIARPNWNFQPDDFQILTLSLAGLFLSRLEDSFPLVSKKGQTRNHLVSLMLGEGGEFIDIFKKLYDRLQADQYITGTIPNSTFAPRVIDKECIHDVMSDREFNWGKFTNYWEERSVRDIVKAFGATEDEKHNVVDMLRQSSHGFYTAGCNDYPEQVDAMLDNLDKEIHLQFNPETDQNLIEANAEELDNQGDVRQLQARISDLEKQLSEHKRIFECESDKRDQRLLEAQKAIEEHNETIRKLTEQLKDYTSWEKEAVDYEALWEQKKTTAHQKIVFFLSVFGISPDEETKKLYNQSELALVISCLSKEKPDTIGPMISRIVQAKKRINNNKATEQDKKLMITLSTAAQSLSDKLGMIMLDSTRNDKSQKLNKIKEDLLLENPMSEND